MWSSTGAGGADDLRRSHRRRLRLEVEEDGEQGGAGHPVHRGMVHLGDDGDALVGQALDDPHLPQGLGPVERMTGDVAGQVGQLAQATRTGHRGPPHVVVDVEVGVVDPHRVTQAERDLHQPTPEHRGAGDPGGDGLLHPLEGIAPGDGGRVENQGEGHVHVESRCLEVQEACVESTQSFHSRPFPYRWGRPVSRTPACMASLPRPDRV